MAAENMLQRQLLIWLFLFSMANVNAQSADFVFKNYDTEDGLCDNNINSIIEDSKGFIWIGTKEGLSRFDGAEFHNFYFTPKDGNNGSYSNLHNLEADKILLLDNFKLTVFNTSKNELEPVLHFKKQKIFEISQLNPSCYALNAGDRFILVDGKLNYLKEIKISEKIVNYLIIRKLSKDKYLIGNTFDYYQYDLTTGKLIPFGINMRQYQKGDFGVFELKFIDEKQQKIYIGDYFTGLYIFDYQGHLLQKHVFGKNQLSSTNFVSFIKDKENSIWIGTHKGINKISNNKIEIIRHHEENDLSVKSDLASCFLLDRNNNMWIGTNRGISVYKSKLNRKIGYIPFAANSEVNINTIAFCGDKLYVGSYLDDAYAIDLKTKKASLLKNETRIWGIYNYDDTIFLSGANNDKEVWSYNPLNNQFSKTDFLKKQYPLTDIITLVYKHSNGDFWYSGNAGGGFVRKPANSDKVVSYYKDQKGKPMFSSSYYSSVCEDAYKNLWFGMNRSNLLLQWNYRTNTFKEINFNDFEKTRNYYFGGITSLKRDSNNFIWISFEGGGIIKYNPKNNTIQNYDSSNGLNSNYIVDIEFDNRERLWIISNKGIGCLDSKTNTFHSMDIWDGFTDVPTNYNTLKMDRRQNLMWLGAFQKLYFFNPDEILKSKKVSTKIYLEYFKVNQKAVDISKHGFAFKPNENNLEFRLVAVDIETGKNLEYSYQLKGLSNKWIDLEANRTVFFQELKAGNYVFNARVKNKGSKDWIYLAKPYSFSIANYWYQTWWFILISVLLLVLLIWLVIWFNFKKKLEKQKAVEEERNRIAADMHDDLGSGLTKITYLSQMALQKGDNKELLSSIKNTSTELVESMSEIIWAMKEENNSWEELLSYLKLYAQDYCQNNNLTVHFTFPEEDMNFKIIGEVRRHIFLSVKECLHNIVKHAEAKNVTFAITKNTTVNITIHDDGKGIHLNQEKSFGGNGLKNITGRMKKINARLSIVKENGTSILFEIPY